MDKITIKRDGLPPIAFTGECIGEASSSGDRWTEVDIYRTQGGKYIAAVRRLTRWDGERSHRAACSRDTAAEIIEWLKEGEAELGSVSQQAVEDAAKDDPGFAAAWVEDIP